MIFIIIIQSRDGKGSRAAKQWLRQRQQHLRRHAHGGGGGGDDDDDDGGGGGGADDDYDDERGLGDWSWISSTLDAQRGRQTISSWICF